MWYIIGIWYIIAEQFNLQNSSDEIEDLLVQYNTDGVLDTKMFKIRAKKYLQRAETYDPNSSKSKGRFTRVWVVYLQNCSSLMIWEFLLLDFTLFQF